MRISNPLRRDLTPQTFMEIMEIFKGMLTDVREAQFPKGIRLKSFQYEMRAIFAESLGHETLFNTVINGSNETHIIVHNAKT